MPPGWAGDGGCVVNARSLMLYCDPVVVGTALTDHLAELGTKNVSAFRRVTPRRVGCCESHSRPTFSSSSPKLSHMTGMYPTLESLSVQRDTLRIRSRRSTSNLASHSVSLRSSAKVKGRSTHKNLLGRHAADTDSNKVARPGRTIHSPPRPARRITSLCLPSRPTQRKLI